MPKKILAALDGSATSESILQYMDPLLRTEDADVTLARVLTSQELEKAFKVRAYLADRAAALTDRGASVKVAVLRGRPAAVLVKYAVEKKADLILVCTRGKTGLKRLLMGSVAEEILRSSPVPVMIVHPADKGAAAPKIRRI